MMAVHVKRFLMIVMLGIVTGVVMTSSSRAADEDSSRKATKKVTPAYSDIARKMQLAGTVRLAALVAADGHVKSTETIGGHPILVAAATEAVMRWKYQAAEKESREMLVFNFSPD
jgi:outer membrane biosynthesis protein TonB